MNQGLNRRIELLPPRLNPRSLGRARTCTPASQRASCLGLAWAPELPHYRYPSSQCEAAAMLRCKAKPDAATVSLPGDCRSRCRSMAPEVVRLLFATSGGCEREGAV